jgi:dimethylpropiothetin dethiomethylase
METAGSDRPDGDLHGLLIAAAGEYRRHSSAIAGRLADALQAVAAAPCDATPATVPACRVLDGLLGPGRQDGHPLLLEVARVRHLLPWRAPVAGRIPEPTSSRLAVVEIVGPDGMIDHPGCRFGLFLQMADFFYPGHRHEAEELYLVLSGTAEWILEASDPARRPPGSFVHHRPWQVHAMNTTDEPLLAMWGWSGNISLDSYSMVTA